MPMQPDEAALMAACDSPERLRARYLELARRAHPDTGGSSARFVALQAAYKALAARPLARPIAPPARVRPPRGQSAAIVAGWVVLLSCAVVSIGRAGRG